MSNFRPWRIRSHDFHSISDLADQPEFARSARPVDAAFLSRRRPYFGQTKVMVAIKRSGTRTLAKLSYFFISKFRTLGIKDIASEGKVASRGKKLTIIKIGIAVDRL